VNDRIITMMMRK